jgi:hypothetical protein
MSKQLLQQNKKAYIRIVSVILILTFSIQARAQLRDDINLPDHDSKFYHLGIALIYNNSHFQVTPHPNLLASDSVLSINPENTGGFGLAGMHTFNFNPHLEFRIVFPELMFSYKNLTYSTTFPSGQKTVATKQIESILLGFPVQVKFLSDRMNNFSTTSHPTQRPGRPTTWLNSILTISALKQESDSRSFSPYLFFRRKLNLVMGLLTCITGIRA